MNNSWTTPSTVVQYPEHESHIQWATDDFEMVRTLNHGVSLSKPLLHISRQPKNDIKMKTWYISATNFNFQNLPSIISGISFRFTVDRLGRVFDDTVQLTYNGELIGENKCSRTVDSVQVYGGSTDLWTVTDIQDIIQDPSFGISVRMKSHPDWPHKTVPILRGLELQIY
jgi:hypothetical protein